MFENRNLEKAISNIAKKSTEIDYNPRTDTNWCHLPMEMREKCIKCMYFETRIRLSTTSKTENWLVNSKKYNFNYVSIRCERNVFTIIARNDIEWWGECLDEYCLVFTRKEQEKVQLALKMLKKCQIDEFRFDGRWRFTSWSPLEFAPVNFRSFEIMNDDWEAIHYILKNCGYLERISIHIYFMHPFQYLHVYKLPSVINAKELQFILCDRVDIDKSLGNMVVNWVEMDAEIGKSLQFFSSNTPTIEVFSNLFRGRIIEKTPTKLRIRMNDNSKQLLVRVKEYGLLSRYHLCKVIPAGLTDTDVLEGDEWARRFK